MKRKVVLILVLILTAAILGGWRWLLLEVPVMACDSPDHGYSFKVLKRNIDTLFVMPGQGSDSRCIVELWNLYSRHLVFRGELNMLQDIEEIRWESDMVWINRLKAISYGGVLVGNWEALREKREKLDVDIWVL